jgi:hypothetical protein
MIGLLLSAVASTAAAVPLSVDTCTPTYVSFQYDDTWKLGFLCSETGDQVHFSAVSPSGSCSAYAQPIDSVKAQLSIVQAAVLAGKKIKYVHYICNNNDLSIGIGMFQK